MSAGLRLPYRPDLPIRTERLELRAFRPEDLESLLAFHSRPEVVRYVPFGPRTPADMVTALDSKLAGISLSLAGDHLDLAVALRDGPLVGDLVVMMADPVHGSVELGWIFDPMYGRRGYATEAVRALLGLVFNGLGAHRVTARVDERNAASRGLCERLQMRREAHLIENEWFKGEWSSEVDYALLAREWAGPSSGGPSSGGPSSGGFA